MESLIDQLYSGYAPILSRRPSAEHSEAIKRLEPHTAKVVQLGGLELADDLSNAYADVSTIDAKNAFREGFLAGSRLILEILTE